MKALEILRDNYILVASDTDTVMAMYYQDHIQKAIKELEALENRSCDNCKNRILTEGGYCCNLVYHKIYVELDFCCNKWVSK